MRPAGLAVVGELSSSKTTLVARNTLDKNMTAKMPAIMLQVK
jgi:hypothetical protein